MTPEPPGVEVADIAVAGGRTVRLRTAGPADGPLVLVHHGTPDHGALAPSWIEAATALGVRLAAFDRPGYGGSTRRAWRTVADVAEDAAAVADHLGADRFATWGVSGGGPHALACAALLGGRVARGASLAGLAPFDADGLNWFNGMGEANRIEVGAALWGLEAVSELLEAQVAEVRDLAGDELVAWFGDVLGDEDRAVLDDAYVAAWAASLAEVFAQGHAGWVDDDLAAVRPWGFSVADIDVPVLVVHGRQDRWVPPGHGAWLAATIPGAEHRVTDDGHLSLDVRMVPEVLGWLVGR